MLFYFFVMKCAKAIIQTGIKEIIYLDNKYENSIEPQVSSKMYFFILFLFIKLSKTHTIVTLPKWEF